MPPTAHSRRKILCVFPAYSPSFGTFENAYPLRGTTRAFMPPQGLLVIASYLPAGWEVRFVDENIRPAADREFAWADAVFVSGMHVQRAQILDINRRAHAQDKVTVLGGPSVSGAPDYFLDFDYLHIGELGDATDRLIETLDRAPRRPARQMRFATRERLPLTDFPLPAYHLAKLDQYFIASVQFSSGCPYRCEFCDIPALYGRVPRLKTPQQVTRELDAMLRHGNPGAVYFVDDNFAANRRALRELLPHLIAWQKRNGYALSLACEATLNIARCPDILALMREAGFETIFCGIETPEPAALKAIGKAHNMMVPMLEAVRIINSYGMEVVSGIILGLDTDTSETGHRIVEFLEHSKIPMATINLLQALPRTPLWDRLKRENRLLEEDASRESNVEFRLPYSEVLAMWRACMEQAYRPEALFARYEHQMKAMWPNRLPRPASRERLAPRNILKGLSILARIIWIIGVRGSYRRVFWKFALGRLLRGEIEPVLRFSLCAHHLIMFARSACAGRSNASHYSAKLPALECEAEGSA